jgi:hypothetical protein
MQSFLSFFRLHLGSSAHNRYSAISLRLHSFWFVLVTLHCTFVKHYFSEGPSHTHTLCVQTDLHVWAPNFLLVVCLFCFILQTLRTNSIGRALKYWLLHVFWGACLRDGYTQYHPSRVPGLRGFFFLSWVTLLGVSALVHNTSDHSTSAMNRRLCSSQQKLSKLRSVWLCVGTLCALKWYFSLCTMDQDAPRACAHLVFFKSLHRYRNSFFGCMSRPPSFPTPFFPYFIHF